MATNGPFLPTNGTPLGWLCRTATLAYGLLVGVAVAGALALAQPEPVMSLATATLFGAAALWGAWSVVVTLALGCATRRWLARWPAAWQGAVLWGVFVGVTALVGGVAYTLDWLSEPAWIGRSAAIAALLGWGIWWAFAGWREEWTQRLLAQEAQHAALIARTQPHFLFNTLNTIAALLPQRPEAAEAALTALAALLHQSLATPAGPWSLAEELAATRTYLSLAALRFGERLVVAWQVTDEKAAQAIAVPRWSLVTLVENAVRHAVARRRAPTPVRVTVAHEAGELTVNVANPVAETPASQSDTAAAPPAGHRLGLALVEAQIRRLGGRLQAGTADGWFVVQWTLPVRGG